MRRTPAGDALTAWGLAAGLTCWNNLVGATHWHDRRYVGANLAATAGLLALARSRGLRVEDLGLERRNARSGLRTGTGVAAVAVAGLSVALATPLLRPLLQDERIGTLSGGEVVRHAAVRVPLGTVVWEEVAFRGVLPPVLARAMPATRADLAAHVLFGLWHIRPTLDALRLNGLVGDRRRTALEVTGGVAFTSAAGVLFLHLRRRSGSLLAPIVLHALVNSSGTVAAAVAERLSQDSSS